MKLGSFTAAKTVRDGGIEAMDALNALGLEVCSALPRAEAQALKGYDRHLGKRRLCRGRGHARAGQTQGLRAEAGGQGRCVIRWRRATGAAAAGDRAAHARGVATVACMQF